MEQNNNNDKGAIDTIKQTAKNEVKKQKNKILKGIMLKIAPFIVIFLLCLLAIGVIMATVFSILNVFKGLLGIEAKAAASTVEESQKMISITSKGYELNDDYADKILEQLRAKKIDTDIAGFSIDDISDMIDKYIEAEIKTMYPTIGKGDIDGAVKIKRMSAETGEIKELTYIDYDDFVNKVNNGNTSVLNNFSLNPDNFKLCIAVSEIERQYDFDNGDRKKISETSTITKKELEYQTSLQRYATPLNYFISMHMVCDSKAFMEDFLELFYDKMEIELTFIESTHKHFTQVDYEGEITTIQYTTEKVVERKEEYKDLTDEEFFDLVVTMFHDLISAGKTEIEASQVVIDSLYITKLQTIEEKGETVEVDTGNINKYSDLMETKQYLIENTSTQGILCVTKANTWRLESHLNVQENDMQKGMIQENEVTNEKNNIDESNTIIKNKPASGSYRTGWLKEITNEWTESYNISIIETEKGYEITEFMDLIESYPKVKDNLESAPNLLFYLLEEDENTQELAALMKYIIFCLTGNDYGVTDLDEIFQIQNFSTIGGFYGSSAEEKLWWALLDAGYTKEAAAGTMGNIQAESGFRSMAVQGDYLQPNQEEYCSNYTNNVDNGTISKSEFVSNGPGGGGYGLAQWTSAGRKEGLYDYAQSISASIGNVNMQIQYLLGEMSLSGGADGYASCGFMEVSREGKIWSRDVWLNASTPEEAAKAYCYSFERPLVFNEERSLNAREIYDKYFNMERPSGAIAIIQAADYIHKYMEENNYTYCVYGVNSYEECGKYGKSHGLNTTFEASTTSYQNTCCATFVSWVLQEAGCLSSDKHSNSANELASILQEEGWIVVNISELQPGDVLCRDHHVEIYAGDNTSYNAGCGDAIRGASPAGTNINGFSYGLRAPN